jgi:hypothetical protein
VKRRPGRGRQIGSDERESPGESPLRCRFWVVRDVENY